MLIYTSNLPPILSQQQMAKIAVTYSLLNLSIKSKYSIQG